MKKLLFFLIVILQSVMDVDAQSIQDSMRYYAFAIAAPKPDRVDQFVRFIEEDLGPNGINALILRVDYNYAYSSFPKLREENPLTVEDVARLVQAARSQSIELIPQINLLGHQSWANKVSKLLEVYPEFDETPHVIMPETYEWPNEDGLYCKSYCPLHPEVHEVVFGLVDEIMEAFEATAFHAGMDEVFYIGDEQCLRCAGKGKAELFAGEVTTIRDHLAEKGQELWIWGDRLIDGQETGLGMWEASENNTHGAIDLIPKDVVICDWHYDNAAPTPAYFATKGHRVFSCFWNKPEVATAHMQMMDFLQRNSPKVMNERFMGPMQTVWSPAATFLDAYYGDSDNEGANAQAASFRAMVEYMKKTKSR